MGMVSSLVSPAAWKERFAQMKRAIDVATKPDKEEFLNESKVSAAGMLIIGAIGFIIFLIYQLTVGGA